MASKDYYAVEPNGDGTFTVYATDGDAIENFLGWGSDKNAIDMAFYGSDAKGMPASIKRKLGAPSENYHPWMWTLGPEHAREMLRLIEAHGKDPNYYNEAAMKRLPDLARAMEMILDEAGARRRSGGGKEKRVSRVGDTIVTPFLKAYLAAALWTGTDEDDDPLDSNYDINDFSKEAMDRAVRDTNRFQTENHNALGAAGDDKQNGHDFWLTRNSHGTGFWDRGYDKEVADKLTKASHKFGEISVYVDDGKIYFG